MKVVINAWFYMHLGRRFERCAPTHAQYCFYLSRKVEFFAKQGSAIVHLCVGKKSVMDPSGLRTNFGRFWTDFDRFFLFRPISRPILHFKNYVDYKNIILGLFLKIKILDTILVHLGPLLELQTCKIIYIIMKNCTP